MNTKYKTLLGFAALIVASGVPASLYATPQQATATISHAGAEPAQASVPRLIQFNGTLKDATTHPVSGVASVTFAIYSEQDGGSPLWSETQNVLADALGHYNVLLGSATSTGVPADLFGTGQSRWLGITIARQQEMPRALMASVPYAMKAGDADTLGGLPASAYVTTQSLSSHPLASGAATTIVASPQIASSSPAANADDNPLRNPSRKPQSLARAPQIFFRSGRPARTSASRKSSKQMVDSSASTPIRRSCSST